ncbi:MAG TPA: choice-of-anchor J domain-containing protein [Pyrinomonadaceae bacterium]|nr:choice-of-anchor J domain-containing protein [Pyrinomonadaceae bacterium]
MLSTFSLNSVSWRKFATTVFSVALVAGAIFVGTTATNAQSFTQAFDVVPAPGWTTQNNSTPVGTTSWFAGNTAVFSSQAGCATCYIGANFNNTTGTNTISNWLVSPNATGIQNGHTLKYWTRTTTANPFPDRLQIRMSLAGASTNVGTGPTGTGDFTTVLRDINPAYDTGGVYPEVWTEFTDTISGVASPTSGRFAFRYFVEMGGPTGDNSNFIGIDTVSYTAGAVVAADAPVDFNGDGRTEWAVVRNTGGGAGGQVTWFYNQNNSANPTVGFAWGISTDFFVSEDFDGDDKDDITVWRPGAATVAAFYIFNSATNTVRVEAFGQTGDDPTVVDDYNGDNKADLAVYRGGASAGDPSFWYYRSTANGPVTYTQWGQNGDFPAPGDYDGNGSADFSVQRNNGGGQAMFWTRLSTGAITQTVFGTPTDVIVPGDYDGDGKTDIATVRGVSGSYQWQYLASSNSTINYITFGASATDFVVQGDYNGDGRTDAAVWRAGAFWVRDTAGGGVSNFTLGASGDYPPANFNSH